MSIVGRVESLWRYPVKSMRGEELPEAFVGFAGVWGDRMYAFRSPVGRVFFPYLTGREQERMLAYVPRFRHPEKMAAPPYLDEATANPPGARPLNSDWADAAVDVLTPDGELLAVDDSRLLEQLRERLSDRHVLSLERSQRAITDSRPVSLFSLGTVRQLSAETGIEIDKRQFRANLYIELDSGEGFGKDQFVGRTVQIGSQVVIAVVARDPRCKMITLDPETGEATPELMKRLARDHEGKAGVYGAVVAEGIIRAGDAVTVL